MVKEFLEIQGNCRSLLLGREKGSEKQYIIVECKSFVNRDSID